MKTFHFPTLTAVIGLFASSLLVSCQNEGEKPGEVLPAGTSYVGVSVRMPRGATRAYNDSDSIAGAQEIISMDIYLLSSDGNTMVYSKRYLKSNDEIIWSSAANGDDVMSPSEPIKTVTGDKQMFVILNSPLPTTFTSMPEANYALSLSVSPLNTIASVDTGYSGGSLTDQIFTDGSVTMDIYPDIVAMSGRYQGTFPVVEGVSKEDAAAGRGNQIAVSLVRIPSRVIVTTSVASFPANVTDETGTVIGTINNLTYSVGQGSNSVYLFGRPVASLTTDVSTPGYSYVPGTDYLLTSPQYYDYSDLANTTDAVPALPTGNNLKALMYMPGKFLLENTHATGTDISNSGYKNGNTAYVLVRAVFIPSAFTDSGTPSADSTFYVGGSNYKIYTSIAAARDGANGGVTNQEVMTYTGGKVLYYVWLNPDVITAPVNSPVVRNNIYHIDITGFKSFGYNWNPLNPSTSNPDPQPGDSTEPNSPMDPTAPLSSTDTYINVKAEILPWSTHSYPIEL